MERLNLNVPKDVREGLKRIAKRDGRREAEVARDLLARAVEEAEREEFARAMAESQTPELRARLRRIAGAMEKLRGHSG